MKLSRLQTYCLNCLCDDYEDFYSIKEQLDKDLMETVSDVHVLQSLEMLFVNRLIDGYKYDSESYKYVITSNPNFKTDWFLINDLGNKELDENWGIYQGVDNT